MTHRNANVSGRINIEAKGKQCVFHACQSGVIVVVDNETSGVLEMVVYFHITTFIAVLISYIYTVSQ